MRLCACGCSLRLRASQKLFASRACMSRAEGQSREKRTTNQRTHIERSKRNFSINPAPKDAGFPRSSWWVNPEAFRNGQAQREQLRMRHARLGRVATEVIDGWM